MADNVNRPAHYTQGKVECIDAIEAALTAQRDPMEAWLTGQVLKYLWRWPAKNGAEDLRKAEFYLKRLIQKVEEKPGEGEAPAASPFCAPAAPEPPEPEAARELRLEALTPKENANRAAAAFKRGTRDRLMAFREKHGLGCFSRIEELSAGITADDCRMMLSGVRFPVEAWRKVAAALDKLEAVSDGRA